MDEPRFPKFAFTLTVTSISPSLISVKAIDSPSSFLVWFFFLGNASVEKEQKSSVGQYWHVGIVFPFFFYILEPKRLGHRSTVCSGANKKCYRS